jgi:zona occludens toxin (predicted ATPase)
MLTLAKMMTIDALLAEHDVWAATVADPGEDWPGDVGRHLAGERMKAVLEEITRRERLQRLNLYAGRESTERYQAWRDVARICRERVSMIDVLERAGWPVVESGREHHAPCPACGGEDRFVVWTERAWCRRCHLSWDIVAAAESLIPGCAQFRDALRYLAAMAGERPVSA